MCIHLIFAQCHFLHPFGEFWFPFVLVLRILLWNAFFRFSLRCAKNFLESKCEKVSKKFSHHVRSQLLNFPFQYWRHHRVIWSKYRQLASWSLSQYNPDQARLCSSKSSTSQLTLMSEIQQLLRKRCTCKIINMLTWLMPVSISTHPCRTYILTSKNTSSIQLCFPTSKCHRTTWCELLLPEEREATILICWNQLQVNWVWVLHVFSNCRYRAQIVFLLRSFHALLICTVKHTSREGF